MRILLVIILGFYINSNVFGNENDGMAYESIQWSVYSELPFSREYEKQPGLAGTFSGLIKNKLVIAGGANFPDAFSQEENIRKYWSDIYLLSLEDPNKRTLLPMALPKNLAYGVSITLPEGILFIGGSNEEGSQKDVFMLQIQGEYNEIKIIKWPSLPVPLTNMTGSLVDNKIYIAGGHTEMNNPSSSNHFFVIDTRNKDEGWKNLDPWPGPPRSFASSAGQNNGLDNCFYLFSGINYGPDSPVEILFDGYEYNTRLDTWKKIERLQDSQFPVLGGAVFTSGANHIIFAGGISDTLINKLMILRSKQTTLLDGEPKSSYKDSIQMINDQIINHLSHPHDFNKHVLFFHTITNTLVDGGDVNFPVPLTTNAINVQDKIFIPGWDYRPGEFMTNIIVGKFLRTHTGIGKWGIIIMIIYFGILILLGWFFSRQQKNTFDYFKGGGNMPWLVVALSIYGTTLSTITFMAIPAKAFSTDWSYIVYNHGLILCIPVIILVFIPFYRKLDITTAYEYLEKRFNLTIRVMASVAFMIFQIGRMAIVLFLPSVALNIITGLDIFLCIVLMGIFSLIYTTMGGIKAVIWTDAIQVIVLFGGVIIAIIFLSSEVEDGLIGIISTASANGKFHLADTSLDLKNPTMITAIIGVFFAGIATYGTDQVVVQRYMTTATKKEAVQSVWGKLIAALIGTTLFFFVGTALYVFYKNHPADLSFTIPDGDAIFPWFIFTQMPTVLSAVVLAGILAAAMSTVSSSINSAATAYSIDIHFRFGLTKGVKDLTIARLSSAIFGLAGMTFAIMMATWEIVSFWDQFLSILGLVMGTFGGLFLLGLLTKRANGTGAIIGIIASILIQIWIIHNQLVHVLLYVATGSLTCFIIGYIASLLTPKSKKDISNLTI